MSLPPDDEVRFLIRAMQWLSKDVALRLWERGWAVTDQDVGDDEPLEWFWPPTAPVGYGGLPDWGDEVMRARPGMYGPRRTPWILPTRLVRTRGTWSLSYGETSAHRPDPPRDYADDGELLDDLERVECWPMTVEETRQQRALRLLETTTAEAHDQHCQAVFPTEPYAALQNRLRPGSLPADGQDTALPAHALAAQRRLLDAESWASAVRTARAGGPGWGVNGPETV